MKGFVLYLLGSGAPGEDWKWVSEIGLDFHCGWISLAGCVGMGLERGTPGVQESIRKPVVQLRDDDGGFHGKNQSQNLAWG